MSVETKTKRRYQRLMDRREQLFREGRANLLSGKDSLVFDMEMDCIDHFFECETYATYETIALFCKENGIERVIDIGSAYGHQSECFLIHGVDYVGVNNGDLVNFWNRDKFLYIVDHYPCKLPIQANDLAVSVLALTWNCYLYEGNKTLTEQCEALKRDFAHCILYLTEEAKETVSRYFKTVKKINRSMYYFSNQ